MLNIQDLLNQNATVQEWRPVRYIADPNTVFQVLNGLKDCTQATRAEYVSKALAEGELTDLELLITRHDIQRLNEGITSATRRAGFEGKTLFTGEVLAAMGNTRQDALKKEAHAQTLEAVVKEAVADFVDDWRGLEEGFSKEGMRHLCTSHQWLYLQVLLHMWDLYHGWESEKNGSGATTIGGAATANSGPKPNGSPTPKSRVGSRRKKPITAKSQKSGRADGN